ncbi:hypothetical protein BOX15_Mlig029656g2 [Macrostomum lignano]|uniref:Double jelly roll-like domain-containing protein n=1 Tax=Macrostomum lignano TaxID=282301 RepID=A0A267DK42_9PLAT|nr:hypothetical protein BOX15_Mlig029656g3 [Macrostomum lignano]PAA55392.1 hypothetical protein BOX15_Mlig029656g2 [Macrostomum lignano]
MENKKDILSIYEDKTFSFFKKKEDYIKISPTPGSTNNLNVAGGQIVHEVNSTESYILMSEAFGCIKYSITQRDNTDLNTNITLEHNWPMRLFSQLIVDIGGTKKVYNDPGEYDTILKSVMYSKLMNEVGEAYGWIPDTGDAGTVSDIPLANNADAEAVRTAAIAMKNRLNKKDSNTGYIRRLENYNNVTNAPNRGGTIKLSLTPLIGFLDWQKISKGIKYKFTWTRKTNDAEIFFGAAGTEAKLTINSFEIWIPAITLSPSAEAAFLKSLNKDITVSFPERVTVPPQLIQGSPYTWNIANISNMPLAIFVAFKYDVNNPSYIVNDHKYVSYKTGANSVKITQLQVRLNQVMYPNDYVEIDPVAQDIHRAYEMYEDICSRFGVTPPFNKQDFLTIYPIFCFDLTAQDEFLVKSGVNIQLFIKKSTNVELTAFALILEQTKNVIKVTSEYQMTRVE